MRGKVICALLAIRPRVLIIDPMTRCISKFNRRWNGHRAFWRISPMSQTMSGRAAVVGEDRNREPVIADSARSREPVAVVVDSARNREPSIVDRARRDRRPPLDDKKTIADQKMVDAILSICVKMCRSLRHIFRLSRTRA